MWGKNSIRRDKNPYVGKSFHTLETMEKMMTLEEKIRDLETQLENEKLFSRHDIMEVRAKNYVLLNERISPLLSDAIDALQLIQKDNLEFGKEIELPNGTTKNYEKLYLKVAIGRITSVMKDVQAICKAHLERIDLNK